MGDGGGGGTGAGGGGGTGTAYELQALSALSPAEFLPQRQSQIDELFGTEESVTELLGTLPTCPSQFPEVLSPET